MVAFAPVSAFTGVSVRNPTQAVSTRPVATRVSVVAQIHDGPGKGFGGGEATRDPTPTRIDPNDPKGKQKAIHAAEGFAEYQARIAREKAGGGGGGGSIGRPAASAPSYTAPAARAPTPAPPATKSNGTSATWAEYQAKLARDGGSSPAGGSAYNASASPRGGSVGSSYSATGAKTGGGKASSPFGSSAKRSPTSSSLDSLYGPAQGAGGGRGASSAPSYSSGSGSVDTSVSSLYSAGGGASKRSAPPPTPSAGHGGKGFGGGEATRDPNPTRIDPSDPKGKQKAIHRAVTWAEYQAQQGRR